MSAISKIPVSMMKRAFNCGIVPAPNTGNPRLGTTEQWKARQQKKIDTGYFEYQIYVTEAVTAGRGFLSYGEWLAS